MRVRDIDNALTQGNQYMVVLEIDPKFQQDPSNLERTFIVGASGSQVPLSVGAAELNAAVV